MRQCILNRLDNFINLTISKIFHNLEFENPLPKRNIDQILQNPADRAALDKAWKMYLNNKSIYPNGIEVQLLDGEILKLSL